MYIVPISGLQSLQPLQPIAPLFDADKAEELDSNTFGLPFSDVLDKAVEELQQAQAVSRKDAYNLSIGRVDNLWEVMVNSQRLSTANSLVTQLTTRAVGAYKEVMQMQV